MSLAASEVTNRSSINRLVVHHPQKPAACTAGRDPRTRRAPSRRSAPFRPGNRAAGAADAARRDDADGPAIAHRRSSNRARSRATPNSRDVLPASPPPSSGQSRNTAPAQSISPGCEPLRVAGGCWVCRALGRQARGTVLLQGHTAEETPDAAVSRSAHTRHRHAGEPTEPAIIDNTAAAPPRTRRSVTSILQRGVISRWRLHQKVA